MITRSYLENMFCCYAVSKHVNLYTHLIPKVVLCFFQTFKLSYFKERLLPFKLCLSSKQRFYLYHRDSFPHTTIPFCRKCRYFV